MSKGLERLNNKSLPCSNCKELKALEIIKEKNVDIGYFLFWKENGSCEDYNSTIASQFETIYKRKYLTQEEYDLLKEVLL